MAVAHRGGMTDDIRDPSPLETALAARARALEALERAKLSVIVEALKQTRGDRRAAARIAGVNERTIHRWIVDHPEIATVGAAPRMTAMSD